MISRNLCLVNSLPMMVVHPPILLGVQNKFADHNNFRSIWIRMEDEYNWLRVSLICILHSKKKNAHFGLIDNFGSRQRYLPRSTRAHIDSNNVQLGPWDEFLVNSAIFTSMWALYSLGRWRSLVGCTVSVVLARCHVLSKQQTHKSTDSKEFF